MAEAGESAASAQAAETGRSEITDDTLYEGRVRLRQLRRGHRAGTDAVLLAAALEPKAGETVFDLGAATGAVGLMIAARCEESRIVFVERDPLLLALCRGNVAVNGLGARATVIEADLLAGAAERRTAGLVPETADGVVTNPPFLDEARSRLPADGRRAAAHAMPEGGLGRWLKACADVLKPRGRLALIHRADRLDACLLHLSRGFGGIRLRAVHPRAGEPAIRVALTAVRGGRAPLTILPPLVLHADEGGFTAAAAALHRGEGRLM
jgi:tRNA1(Val) A37 N6-methylase TrmN6